MNCCGDLEIVPITRQKVVLEGDVSSRGLTGGNLRDRIRPFNGSVGRSHKFNPSVIGRSCECTGAARPRPMEIAMGRCCFNELNGPVKQPASYGFLCCGR